VLPDELLDQYFFRSSSGAFYGKLHYAHLLLRWSRLYYRDVRLVKYEFRIRGLDPSERVSEIIIVLLPLRFLNFIGSAQGLLFDQKCAVVPHFRNRGVGLGGEEVLAEEVDRRSELGQPNVEDIGVLNAARGQTQRVLLVDSSVVIINLFLKFSLALGELF
jgi:hypothetical protein